MQHLRLILYPGEQILYRGRIHPIVYLPGIFRLLVSIAVMRYLPALAHVTPYVEYKLSEIVYAFPTLRYTPEAVAGFYFLTGVSSLLQAYLKVYSTELMVTTRRVLMKSGITTITTVEIERNKIASVVVQQSITGQMLGYGRVIIQSMSGIISGLPILMHPHRFQQQLYAPVQ